MDDQQTQFFGVITIGEIQNIFHDPNFIGDPIVYSSLISEQNIKFVHYPDCQQLIIWLPEHHSTYERLEIKDLESEFILYNELVKDIINGSVQIIIDSLFLYPGEFQISILKNNSFEHIIHLKKYPEGFFPPVEISVAVENINGEKEPIVYRDGYGNILPNEDLILREAIINKTINKVFRKLEFVSYGRDGDVIYIEGDKHIHFYMEMGGYNCLFFLHIPKVEEWESITKFPLSEREEILQFVAEGTKRDQASSCNYKITDREIVYYRKN